MPNDYMDLSNMTVFCYHFWCCLCGSMVGLTLMLGLGKYQYSCLQSGSQAYDHVVYTVQCYFSIFTLCYLCQLVTFILGSVLVIEY